MSSLRAAEAIESEIRAPLEPELPIDPDAPIEQILDPDTIEALNETQALAPDDDPEAHGGAVRPHDRAHTAVLTGGDVDAAYDQADSGEETVGGSTPTPDQDVVDDLGRAAGVTYSDTEPLRPMEKEAQRDDNRWELDPASAEDYQQREQELRRPPKKRGR